MNNESLDGLGGFTEEEANRLRAYKSGRDAFGHFYEEWFPEGSYEELSGPDDDQDAPILVADEEYAKYHATIARSDPQFDWFIQGYEAMMQSHLDSYVSTGEATFTREEGSETIRAAVERYKQQHTLFIPRNLIAQIVEYYQMQPDQDDHRTADENAEA